MDNAKITMENQEIMNTQSTSDQKYHIMPQLTNSVKHQLAQSFKRLIINKELTEFISESIKKMPAKDKLATLYYFKKLAVQVYREPDPEHFKAFKDVYLEEMSGIADEQAFFEPVKWINAEIEYISNTAERLTSDDVNQRLEIMQDAKLKLSKDWLTKEEVMQLFRISKSTLNRRIAEGMPHHKIGKAVYFNPKEINEWINKAAA
jgi:predicted DNA-binding transcriptional regulator AlpA